MTVRTMWQLFLGTGFPAIAPVSVRSGPSGNVYWRGPEEPQFKGYFGHGLVGTMFHETPEGARAYAAREGQRRLAWMALDGRRIKRALKEMAT